MPTLTIDASNNDAAQGLRNALGDFGPRVQEKPQGGYQVVVSLRGGDAQVSGILSALERHVTERGDGPARVEMAGRSYTLYAEPNGTQTPPGA
jgi:hypothetical protein